MQAKARKNHKNFKKFGQKSLHILDSNIRNPRYPGFSQFTSSNALRNSSYCWTIGKDSGIKDIKEVYSWILMQNLLHLQIHIQLGQYSI